MSDTNQRARQLATEACLNTFNFERVHKVMQEVDWKWYTEKGYQVPTLVQLILAAQKRCHQAWDNKETVESGGLRAVFVPAEVDDYGKVEPAGLELMFILTQTQSY